MDGDWLLTEGVGTYLSMLYVTTTSTMRATSGITQAYTRRARSLPYSETKYPTRQFITNKKEK